MKPDGRLSLNQATVRGWSLPEAVDGCRRAGIGAIGLWRDKVAEVGLAEAARLVERAGLRVSSLCRGGFFAAPDPAGPALDAAARAADNRRAVDEAAALGAGVLVLVCGGTGAATPTRARRAVADGLAALADYAAGRGVRLGIEPLHPMYAADRSVVTTLAEAIDLAAAYPSDVVGVVVDAYHVWWDPRVSDQIARAGPRIAGFHVCDWVAPPADWLAGRAMMGDGCVDLRGLREAVDAAGYEGPIEVEVLNAVLWREPGDDVVARCVAAYASHVA